MGRTRKAKLHEVDFKLRSTLPVVYPILVREQTERSFYTFFQTFWHVIEPKAKGHFNWHVKYLCDELQKIAEPVFADVEKQHDLIINIPPGSTKSSICSVMFPAWIWGRMPHARILCASYTDDLSGTFLAKTKKIVTSELYQHSFPHVKFSRMTKDCLYTVDGGERRAVGVMGNVTGRHAHFIIIDDPINPNTASSDKGLAMVNEWMDHTISTRTIITDKVLTPTILIMQRLNQNDPTGHWLAREGSDGDVKHICLPADLGSKSEVKPIALQKYYRDNLLDPVRFSHEFLAKRKAKLGEFGYACQYDQSPVPRGLGFFKTDNIRCMNAPPLDSFVQLCRFAVSR
jgi:hypothetical protein